MDVSQYVWSCLLFMWMFLHTSASKDTSLSCPATCEPEKCPNIGPIKISDCPLPYLATDRCGCCKRCEVFHPTSTVSPGKREQVCETMKCPKKRVCVLNMQGLPVCRCPSELVCKTYKSRSAKVCGSDGETYPSRCHLKVAACKLNKKIRVSIRGSCSERSGSERLGSDTANFRHEVGEPTRLADDVKPRTSRKQRRRKSRKRKKNQRKEKEARRQSRRSAKQGAKKGAAV